MLRNLLTHVSSYSLGSALATLASFISFPLLARHFSVADYGVINLISVTLLLLTSVAKAGMQNSVVRFHAEERARRDPSGMRRYKATVVYGIVGTGLVVTAAWLPIVEIFPSGVWKDPRIPGLLALAASLVTIRSLDSALANLLRAEQRSVVYGIYQVIKRYLGLAGIVIALELLSGHVTAYYVSMVITELAAAAGLAYVMFHREPIAPGDFSMTYFRRMLVFGIPLAGLELSGIVLNLGDRYVLNGMLGKEAVGIYSAAANLCDYVEAMFIFSLGQALQPIYVRTWEEKGERETINVIARAFHIYIIVTALIVAGISAIGRELLLVLASAKYLPAASIVPWLMGGVLLRGSGVIFSAGLYIHKQSRRMLAITASIAVINILLNVALIPILGITGSAVATLLSYLLQSAAMYRLSNRMLKVAIPWSMILRYVFVGGALYFACIGISVGGVWITLGVKLCVGAVVFAAACWIVDPEVRRWSRLGMGQLMA